MNKEQTLRWRALIESPAGRAGLDEVTRSIPVVPCSSEAHQMHFAAGKVEGWRECIQKILSLRDVEEDEPAIAQDDTLSR